MNNYNKYHKDWRNKRRAAGLCPHCGKTMDRDGYICISCCVKKCQQAEHLKLDAFNAYGGAKCACCGEDELVFLTLDHIEENGAEHRKELGGRNCGSTAQYRWLKKNDYPPGFQVLCFNCNVAKYRGGCPHQRKKDVRQLTIAG
jgi:hypothetical protein